MGSRIIPLWRRVYVTDSALPASHLKVAICVLEFSLESLGEKNTGDIPPEGPGSVTPGVHIQHAAGASGGQPGLCAI